MNSDNFVQSNNVIYKLMCAVKKRSEDILFTFIVEVSFNAVEITLNNSENVVKLTENNNTVQLMKNDDTVKSINYNDFMNMTFESSAHTITD